MLLFNTISDRYVKRKLILMTIILSLMLHVFFGRRTTKKTTHVQFKQMPRQKSFQYCEYVVTPHIKYQHKILKMSSSGEGDQQRDVWIPDNLKEQENKCVVENADQIEIDKQKSIVSSFTSEGSVTENIDNSVSEQDKDAGNKSVGKSPILNDSQIEQLPIENQFNEIIRTLAERHGGINTHVTILHEKEEYTKLSNNGNRVNGVLTYAIDNWPKCDTKMDNIWLGLKVGCLSGKTIILIICDLSKSAVAWAYNKAKGGIDVAKEIYSNRHQIDEMRRNRQYYELTVPLVQSGSDLVIELFANFLSGKVFTKENASMCTSYLVDKTKRIAQSSKKLVCEYFENAVLRIKNTYNEFEIVKSFRNSNFMWYSNNTTSDLEMSSEVQSVSLFVKGKNLLLAGCKYIGNKVCGMFVSVKSNDNNIGDTQGVVTSNENTDTTNEDNTNVTLPEKCVEKGFFSGVWLSFTNLYYKMATYISCRNKVQDNIAADSQSGVIITEIDD